jgi:ABC-2 type transport system permease protein
MSASRRRIFVVARREFLTTVRRRAFILTLLGTPAYFAFVTVLSGSAELQDRKDALQKLNAIGVVDSSGLYAQATREIQSTFVGGGFGRGPVPPTPVSFHTKVLFFPDVASAQQAVRSDRVPQVIVIPQDYVATGRIIRYARSNSPFSSTDRRAIGAWLARNLVAAKVDARTADRVGRPTEDDRLYTLNRAGQFELKNDAREIGDILVPMFFSLLLGLSIIIGGQYLLQGVAEEKETRILESLLCEVSAEELLAGKLFGLGAVGLLTVGVWMGLGFVVSGPALAILPVHLQPSLVMVAALYFLFGYLFFGSIMTGIGAVTNNMREAQQFAVWFTFANFVPFILFTTILGRPDAPVSFWLSMFPPTASTAMMLRLAAPNSAVPAWQVVVSVALLAAAAGLTLRVVARIFRIGLLMHGKTPTLPEIVRWARQT